MLLVELVLFQSLYSLTVTDLVDLNADPFDLNKNLLSLLKYLPKWKFFSDLIKSRIHLCQTRLAPLDGARDYGRVFINDHQMLFLTFHRFH